MTRGNMDTESCIQVGKQSLEATQSSVQKDMAGGDPAEKILRKVNQKEFTDFLWAYGIPKSEIMKFLNSQFERRNFLANNDVMKVREIAQLITEGKDIKQLMLTVGKQTGKENKNLVLAAALLSYESSVAQIPQYTLFNQIYSVNINGQTPVVYGGEKMTYFEAQKKQASNIVVDHIGDLKKICEDRLNNKK